MNRKAKISKWIRFIIAFSLLITTFGNAQMVSAETTNVKKYVERYSGGDGTKENPWKISTVEDLMTLRIDKERDGSYGGKIHYFELTNDIIFNEDYKNYKDWGSKAPKNRLSKAYDVYGREYRVDYAYIDGKGHTIYGLYGDGNSLFHHIYDVMIKNLNFSCFYMKNAPLIAKTIGGQGEIAKTLGCDNLKLDKGIVVIEKKKLTKEDEYGIGGMFYQVNSEAKLKNISVNMTMTTDNVTNIGMIAGGSSPMTNCTTAGKLTVTVKNKNSSGYFWTNVGGLVGEGNQSGTWKNCKNKANIIVSLPADKNLSGYYAGIVASTVMNKNIKFSECTNQGNITINSKYTVSYAKKHEGLRQWYNVAGISATLTAGTVKDCVNKGNIKAEYGENIGGILAQGRKGVTISNCLNTGKITSVACGYVAGIAGEIEGKITHCENRGEIVSTEKLVNKKDFLISATVAGIAATTKAEEVNSTISYCKNTGHVNGIDTSLWMASSGIVGTITGEAKKRKVTVSNCVNEGLIEGGKVSGIVSSSAVSKDSDRNCITNCVNTGTVRHNYKDDRLAGIAFIISYTDVSKCYNLGKIDNHVKSGYGDDRVCQLVSLNNNKSKVRDCYALKSNECKWPTIAYTQTGATTKNITRLSKTQLKNRSDVKKIIKNAGLIDAAKK